LSVVVAAAKSHSHSTTDRSQLCGSSELLFDLWPFYWSSVLLFSDTVLIFYGKAVLLATAFFCALRYRVGDTLLCFKLNVQFNAN